MHNNKKYRLGMLIAILLFLMPLHGHAGIYTATFLNEFQTDAVYLFLYDDSRNHDVRFQDVTLTGPSSWGVAEQTDTFLQFSGVNEAGPGDLRFSITFEDGRNSRNMTPFTLEWAEYLNGSPSTSGAMGTLSFERNRGSLNWVASSDFNSTVPTPIPGSTWLLMSGLFFLAGVRRHNRR
jgi:hypothetical protein